MLNSLREGASAHIIKIVALGFVLLGVGGMVFMDVGGFFRDGASDTTLARIGRTKISVQAFERTAQPAVRAQNMNMQEAYRFGLLQNLLDEMSAREALRQEAVREGLLISREDIAMRVHDMVKTQVQPGETAQKALDRILRTQGLTQDDLIASMRQSMTSLLIEAPLKASVSFVPKLATEALGRFQAERRDIEFFTLTPESVGATIKADDATLKAYYDTIKDQYQIPEQRSFRALVLSVDDIKAGLKITDADVRAAYDERKDQFKSAERRKIEQALFQDEAKAKAASDLARKKASIKAVVTPSEYREPTTVEQQGLPADLASAVFAAQKGTVLNPIKTPLGWHVIRVIDTIPARVQPFGEVAGDLRRELESDSLHSEMESRIAKVDEELSQGDTLDQISKNLNLAITNIGPIDVHGNIEPNTASSPLLTTLSQNKDLLSSLFELMEGETGDLSEINEGLYAVFSLDAVRPTRDRDFAEVQAVIEKKWLDEQRQAAVTATVDKLVGEVSRKEKDFAEAAKEAGVVLKTARDVSRESKVAGINDPVALTRLFDETDLTAIVKVPTSNGIMLAKVLDARIPEAGQGKATPDTEKQWRTQMEQAVTSLYVSDLRRDTHAKINTKLLEKMYGTPADGQP